MAAARSAADKERAEALAQMDLRKIVRAYIQQMVDEVPGYKALLLDKDTMRICSTLFGRTELGDHGVFHVERLDGGEGKDHMELKVRPRGPRNSALLLASEPASRSHASMDTACSCGAISELPLRPWSPERLG